jgi:hypothetical protein
MPYERNHGEYKEDDEEDLRPIPRKGRHPGKTKNGGNHAITKNAMASRNMVKSPSRNIGSVG